jgi:hypothetical protein
MQTATCANFPTGQRYISELNGYYRQKTGEQDSYIWCNCGWLGLMWWVIIILGIFFGLGVIFLVMLIRTIYEIIRDRLADNQANNPITNNNHNNQNNHPNDVEMNAGGIKYEIQVDEIDYNCKGSEDNV